MVAIDEHTDTIEVQYFDGNLDEFEKSTWYELDMERVEEPEDWDVPYQEEAEKKSAGPREPD